jgi:hypothetical protein
MSDIPLREYFERLMEERFSSHTSEHEMLWRTREANFREFNRRFDEMDKALEKLANGHAKYLSRDLYDERHAALEAQLNALSQRLSNYDGRFYMLGGMITVIVVIIELVMRFVR